MQLSSFFGKLLYHSAGQSGHLWSSLVVLFLWYWLLICLLFAVSLTKILPHKINWRAELWEPLKIYWPSRFSSFSLKYGLQLLYAFILNYIVKHYLAEGAILPFDVSLTFFFSSKQIPELYLMFQTWTKTGCYNIAIWTAIVLVISALSW